MNKTFLFSAALAGAGAALVSTAMPAGAVALAPLNTFDGSFNGSNLSVDLADIGSGKVQFTFSNVGPTPSSIGAVYFGKGSSFSSVMSFATNGLFGTGTSTGGGVAFSEGARPDNPQGGIKWESAFDADADSPSGYNKNGVDLGESLKVTFNLINGATFNSVYSGFQSGQLAIAMHVQSIGGDNGPSAWVGTTNVTTQDIPEPFTMLGTGAALGFGALFKRERDKQQKRKAEVKA